MSPLLNALVVLTNVLLAFASSAPPRPLSRIDHPTTHALEILPRHNSLKKREFGSPFLEGPTLYHSDSFRLTLSAFNETFHLHLRPNDELIHPAARINYYKDGVLDRTVPLVRESVRAYWGEVVAADRTHQRMREDAAGVIPRPELGWARILVHGQGDADSGIPPVFEGAFSVRGVTHNVQTRDNYARKRLALDPELVDYDGGVDSQLVIWRDSDVVPDDDESERKPRTGCAHADPWMTPTMHSPWDDSWSNSSSLARRQDAIGGGNSDNFADTIGQIAGCPSTQRILYMGVAADCTYVSAHGTVQNATTQIINNWNTASSLYKSTFNVSLGIIEINVQEPDCPSQAPSDTPWNVGCTSSGVTLNDRLSLFSDWRGNKGSDGAGLWHLMSGCPTGSEVGVAWLGTLCQQTVSGSSGSRVSGTAVSTNGRTEWEVVAHEIGHNFGAIHDCQGTCSSSTVCCPLSSSNCDADDMYIMSPVTSSSQKTFSPCSIGNICSLMLATSANAVNTTCLADPSDGIQTISLNMCGNGIVEDGEDCDPGQGTTSACCDAATCRFANNAQCDPASSPCCTNSCTFAPSGQVCRPAADASCDIAETCSGNSSACPSDQFQPNGQSCGSLAGDNLACANGVCTSLNQQCRVVGASLGLTEACSRQDTSCRVSCQDPNNDNQCIQLQAVLIDGSSCGYGGTCESGQCQSGSALDTAKAWYVQNLQISIPITVVAAIAALLLIWSLILCCKRHCGKKPAPSMEPALSGQRGARLSSWQPPPTLPPVVPFGTRPQPPQPQTQSQRRVSIPPGLRPGEMRNVPPTSFPSNGNGVPPPASPRNLSWDAAYGQPVAGSARMPSSNNSGSNSRRLSRNSGGSGSLGVFGGVVGGRPGSSGGGSTRAREPAFPIANVASQQQQSRVSTGQAHWVDPTAWNGPMR